MADFQDIPPASNDPAKLWKQLTTLLVGADSIEVLPNGQTVVFRVWFQQHCDPLTHTDVT